VKYYYMSLVCLCAAEALCFGGVASAQTTGGPQSQAPLSVGPGAAPASNTGSYSGEVPASLASTISHLPASITDGGFTLNGISLYGGIDVGVGYQSHGAPFNGTYGPGRNYLIQNTDDRPQFGAAPNALSYSNIGLRGVEPIMPGLNAIFNLNTTFNPYSGQLSNNLDTLVQNNGLSKEDQISGGDSSRNGQAFNSYAYFGLSSAKYGTITFGRQNSLPLDEILIYDPLEASNAFSVIGYQGATAGGGTTEDARLDDTFQYRYNYGRYHVIALTTLGDGDSDSAHSAYQFDAGATFGGLDVDAVFSKIHGAVSASSLGQPNEFTPAGDDLTSNGIVEPSNSLQATIADNTAAYLMAKYTLNQWTYYAGYSHIGSANPSGATTTAFSDDGTPISYSNITAFPKQKELQVFWAGFRYAYSSKLEFRAAYYQELQNSYGTGSFEGCHTSISPTCSGETEAVSMLADYHFTKRLDSYFGAEYSTVSGGQSSGFLARNTIDPTLGLRVTF
jgi:predicted porin